MGRDAPLRGERPDTMADDLEAQIADLERQLRELQAEVGQRAAPPPPPREAEPRVPEDPLDRFGSELRRLASELVAAWDRVAAHERAARAHRQEPIVLEARASLHALSALERALAQAPGVAGVELRAYAAGHASLVVTLE